MNSKRAPLITIEGVNFDERQYVITWLSHEIKTRTLTNRHIEDDSSKIAIVIQKSENEYETFKLSAIVKYYLQNSNFWEIQSDIEKLLNKNVTVILDNYVLTNRANLISEGLVSPDFCFQADEGLLKPDLQMIIPSKPGQLLHDFFSESIESKINFTKSLISLAERDSEVNIINNDPVKQARDLYHGINLNDICEFQYYNGYK
jgi:hypothetical protein